MSEAEKDSELEDLFETFDKQLAACEQKLSAIDESLKAFRAEQDDKSDPLPEQAE